MKWQDTVIKLKAVPKKIFENKDDTIDIKMAYLAGWKDGTERQANATWDAAIKEVVGWIKSKNPYSGLLCIERHEWESKLKEWLK